MSLIVTLASQSIDQKVVETAHVSVRYGHVNFKMAAPRVRVCVCVGGGGGGVSVTVTSPSFGQHHPQHQGNGAFCQKN